MIEYTQFSPDEFEIQRNSQTFIQAHKDAFTKEIASRLREIRFHASEKIKALKKGKLTGKQDITLNLLKLGMPIEQIAQATGLSLGEIKILQ